jgi:hypothetical protein
MTFRTAVRIAALALIVPCARSASAGERKPLPAFGVTAPDGARVSSSVLATSERWLIVYGAANCVSCDRLVHALEEWNVPRAGGRTVVIVEVPAEGSGTAQAAPDTYLDPGGAAARALGLTERPAVLGIENGAIEWVVQGVLNDPNMLKELVQRWLQP